MARFKAHKTKQKAGLDFKKIKRRIGRKLPPSKNVTDTTIKAKAIVLPEQSVASDKSGLALSKSGLTLKELLQKTSHHNAKIRGDALNGIRDLFLNHPSVPGMHKLAVIEKLCECISDDDRLVREKLYELLKLVIFPRFKQDLPGPIISLMMACVFNALTHLSLGIRLMAFKLLDLIFEHYPSSFYLYAEKALKNYEDIMRSKHIYFEDKSTLRIALVGLVRCLSLLASDEEKTHPTCLQETALHAYEPGLPEGLTGNSSIIYNLEALASVLMSSIVELTSSERLICLYEANSFDCLLHIVEGINLATKICIRMRKNLNCYGVLIPSHENHNRMEAGKSSLPMILKKLFEMFPLCSVLLIHEKGRERYFMLNLGVTEIFLQLCELDGFATNLTEKYLTFMETALLDQAGFQPKSATSEKHIITLLSIIPKVIQKVDVNWKYRLLEAFTRVFLSCKPESAFMLACLYAIREILFPGQELCLPETSSQELLHYCIAWFRLLPELLLSLDDKHPSTSELILQLQHQLGQRIPLNSILAQECDKMQHLLREFYSKGADEGRICYGPFLKLPRACQELAVSCLYYFSNIGSTLLQSITRCFLCDNIDSYILFRIIEVLHSAYEAGHMQISHYASFLFTIVTEFKVFPDISITSEHIDSDVSNRCIFRAIVDAVCSSFSKMGDNILILRMLQKIIFDMKSCRRPLDNMRAVIRLVLFLDPECSQFEQRIGAFSDSIFEYLISTVLILLDKCATSSSSVFHIFNYFAQPVMMLFKKNQKLLSHTVELLGSSISFYECTPQYLPVDFKKIYAFVFTLTYMHEDGKLHRSLSQCRATVKQILQNALMLEVMCKNIQENQMLKDAVKKLKIQTDRLHCWNADDFLNISNWMSLSY